MSLRRSQVVQILNPQPGGSRYTTYKTALKLVRRGRATFEAQETAIRFTDQSLRRPDGSVGGVFRWHRGTSGGMAQLLGSAQNPSTDPIEIERLGVVGPGLTRSSRKSGTVRAGAGAAGSI